MKKLNNLTHLAFLSILSIFSVFLFSCGTEEEPKGEIITVTASPSSVVVGNPVSFTANSSTAGDITSSAIFYVNGSAIEGNTFTPSEASMNNEVYATYNGIQSATAVFASTEEGGGTLGYTQKVLVEDYTGTWCVACPRMVTLVHYYTEHSPNVIPVAIHCDTDPYKYEHSDIMVVSDNYNAQNLPVGKFNRIYTIDQKGNTIPCPNDPAQYTQQLDTYLNQVAPVGLAITSSLNGDKININVKVGFADDNITNPRLVVQILQDEGLHYDQKNAFANNPSVNCDPDPQFNYYAMPNPIPNFPQNHVLLKSYTDIFGDPIPTDQVAVGHIYSKNFDNQQIPALSNDPSKLKIVAFVLGNGDKNSNRAVLNVQSAMINTTQDFD